VERRSRDLKGVEEAGLKSHRSVSVCFRCEVWGEVKEDYRKLYGNIFYGGLLVFMNLIETGRRMMLTAWNGGAINRD
jgi:hypothetical protein